MTSSAPNRWFRALAFMFLAAGSVSGLFGGGLATAGEALERQKISSTPMSTPATSHRIGDAPDPHVVSIKTRDEGWRAELGDLGVDRDPEWILVQVRPGNAATNGGQELDDSELEAAVTAILERLHVTWPEVPVAVEGLVSRVFASRPGADPEGPPASESQLRLASVVSAFVIDRTLLILDPSSSGLERRWILDRYPSIIEIAGDRPIFFRSLRGWRCLDLRGDVARSTTGTPAAGLGGEVQSVGSPDRPLPKGNRPADGSNPTVADGTSDVATSRSQFDGETTELTEVLGQDQALLDPAMEVGASPLDVTDAVSLNAPTGSDRSTSVLATGAIAASFQGAGAIRSSPAGSDRNRPQASGSPLDPSEKPGFASRAPIDTKKSSGARGVGGIGRGSGGGDGGGGELGGSRNAATTIPTRAIGNPEGELRPVVMPTWIPDSERLVIPIGPGSSTPPPAPLPAPRPDFETDENGWTDFSQFLETDSRIMYVAANGDDATGVVYAPDNSALGSDPMQPTGAVQAFATYEAARSHMRDFKADWILFRRGDTFILPNGLYSHGTHFFFQHDPNGPAIRKVFGAYGALSNERPIVTSNGSAIVQGVAVGLLQHANSAFVSLDLRSSGVGDGNHNVVVTSGNRNFHFEDCRIRGGMTFQHYNWSGDPNTRYCGGVVFRRCAVVDAARSSGGHVQGLFAKLVEGLVLEECVFDRNGYVEDPTDPSTWSGKLETSNQNSDPTAIGDGVQPHRTWFSRNLYLSSYTDLYIRGCILSRSASSHQMRAGGVAERNVFLWNDQALAPKILGRYPAFLQGQTLSQNLVLHEDHLLASALQAGGMTAMVGETNEAVVHDNVTTGFNRSARYMYGARGLEEYSTFPAEVGDRVTFTDNVGFARSGTAFSTLRGTTGRWGNGYAIYEGSGNQIAIESNGLIAVTTEPTAPSSWTFGSNHYTSGSYRIGVPDATQTIDFAAWQAAGFDIGSTEHADIASMASALGWQTTPDAQGRPGWERDIVSYMESIDPTYTVDENVTVDDGVPVTNRRANAPKVWEVLAGLDAASNADAMSQADAKTTAWRYHALLVFLERARANRKGAWDPAYTADALNNYIRAGFGKPPVGGEYTAELPENMP